jgi:hypothetical protein
MNRMAQSIRMMRIRPPIAMPAIAPTEVSEPFEATFDAEGVGDAVEDVDAMTFAMRVGA